MRLRTTLLLVSLFLLGVGRLSYAQDYFIGPDELHLPAGAVLGTDSYGPYADVPTSSDRGYLAQESDGDPVIAAGRYRASFLIRTSPFGRSEAYLQFAYASDAAPVYNPFISEVTGPDLPSDGSVCSLSMEVWAPSGGGISSSLTYEANASGELTAVRVYGLSLVRLDGGLGLTKVRPRKILYEPEEAGVVDVTVSNFTNQQMSGTLQLTLTQELDRDDPQPGVPVTVPAGQAVDVALPFPGRTLQYGCEARVRLTQGEQVLDKVSDVFSVSDNVFKVGLGAGTLNMTAHSGALSAQHLINDVETCRKNYFNWWEKMFWAPDDWGDLTPEPEEWISGQTARWENASRIREFIAALKPNGIKSITYGKQVASGPQGWELLREHPEWFYAAPEGTPAGSSNSWDFANWNDIALHIDPVGRALFSSDYHYAYPDLRQPAVLEWGISELIQSMQDFGWDGVRFDGHWTAGNDALSTDNMQRLKQAMWEEDPNFLLGFNWSYSFGYQCPFTGAGPVPLFEHEFRESMAGGGAFVQEVINGWGYGPAAGESYHLWSEYAAAEEAAARGVHALGGNYHFVYSSGSLNPIDQLYKFAIGTMCGVHPVYGDSALVPLCPNWGRFLTRWSSLVWDTEAQPVSDGDVEVISGGSLLWYNWAKQRVVDTGSRQVIVHLLNPQLDDSIEVVDDLLPPPVSEVVVRVRIPLGQTVIQAMLLDPRQGDQPTPLAITLNGGYAEVTVPQVEVWSIVVFEFSGSFALPPSRDQFTELPDAGEVAVGRNTIDRAVGAPLTEEELAGQRPWLYETDGVYSSVPAHGVVDPDAGNGYAQVRESTESNAYIGRSYLGGFPPGRYVARMRAKLEDTNTPPHPQTMNLDLYIYDPFSVTFNYYGTPGLGYPPERTLIADGVYHYYDLPFELQEFTSITIGGGTDAADPTGTRFLLDHILVEQLEAYTDASLDQEPPTSVQVGGAPGLDVLVANGFTWDTYRLPEIWGSGARVQQLWAQDGQPIDFPQRAEDLAPFDVVMLANVDVSWMGLAGRRALRDFVASGGGLVLLGGTHTLGQGFLSGTYVADLLPVEVSPVRDLQQATPPLVLTAAPTTLMSTFAASLLDELPEVYWRHLTSLKTGAEVHLYAGSEPVLVTGSYGQGRVTVFSGATLGLPLPDQLPFWQWDDWPVLLNHVIYWTWTSSLPEHAISVSASSSPSTAISGGNISLSAGAADSYGHDIASWSWSDGGAGGRFTPSASVPSPTYTAPANTSGADIIVTLTVTATCDGPSPESGSETTTLTVRPAVVFSDVLPDHWAYEYIMACYNAGIVNGYPGNVYLPDLKVTRAQMAMYVSRALVGGVSVPEGPEEATFPDVATDHWAYDAVEYAVEADVVGGYPGGTYQPAWIVTRGQMAVFIARAIVNPTGEEGLEAYAAPVTPSFGDVPADYWAFKHVEYCVGEEVVLGYLDGSYKPTQEVTRDQMAVYISRAFGLLD